MPRPDVAHPGDPDADAPDWWRRSGALRRVPLVAALLIAVILFRATQSSSPPQLTTSCTTPAFALSSYSTASHHEIQWSATGPAKQRFALTIGVADFRNDDGKRLVAEPEPGLTREQVRSTSVQTMGDGCTAHGHFSVVLPAGTYPVRLFTISGTGLSTAATPAAEKRLVVTG